MIGLDGAVDLVGRARELARLPATLEAVRGLLEFNDLCDRYEAILVRSPPFGTIRCLLPIVIGGCDPASMALEASRGGFEGDRPTAGWPSLPRDEEPRLMQAGVAPGSVGRDHEPPLIEAARTVAGGR